MSEFDAAFARNRLAVLQFSGGKDSLACLYLLRPYWDRLVVMWVNTGDAFPETIEQMASIKALVPRFLEVRSAQPKQIADNGLPADVLSVWDTPMGRQMRPGRSQKLQTALACCNDNLWQPAAKATHDLNATLVIRGQRQAEAFRTTVRSGTIEAGVEYLFPIERWTNKEVRDYLDRCGVALPEHYAYVDSSLDCKHCTAYLSENYGKFIYMQERHPALHSFVRDRVHYILKSVAAEATHLLEVTK